MTHTRTSRRRRPLALLAVLLLGIAGVAVACGEDAATEQASRPGTKVEQAFLASMVPHHESASQMARLAEQRAERPEVKAIARAIETVQPKEVEQMRAIHQRLFGRPLRPDMGAHMALGLSADEAGMDHMDGARTIADADPFDRAFLEEMIPHHEGATTMAEAVRAQTQDAELRALATDIIAAQREEIEQMQRILDREGS